MRRTSITGIALGLAALIACELPILLALIGLGSLGAAASILQPPFWIEVASAIVILLGILVLVGLAIRHRRFGARGNVK